MERYGGGAIVVREYDPAWPEMFEQERAHLYRVLGSIVTTIEHVGSTAVPGLAAKPIIDLLVGVRSLDEGRSGIAPLQAIGYTYVPEYESWLPGELFFRKGGSGPWTHHVHMMELGNPRAQDQLLFRDYLRAHPEIASDYAKLKKSLAAEFGEDIAGFRTGKSAFVKTVTANARAAHTNQEVPMAQVTLPPWIQPLQQRDPEFVASYVAQRERIMRDGAIPAKYKHLMTMIVDALDAHPDGVANIANRARAAGASEAEIQEAVEVAYLFGGTPALVTAMNAFKTS